MSALVSEKAHILYADEYLTFPNRFLARGVLLHRQDNPALCFEPGERALGELRDAHRLRRTGPLLSVLLLSARAGVPRSAFAR